MAEELQAIEQESLNDGHHSEVTQENDLEQEDSETSLTEDEEPSKYYKDIETAHYQSDNLDKYSIDHTEEVIIGLEQGTTCPTKMGTTVCNVLIDTGATRCCISEEYY